MQGFNQGRYVPPEHEGVSTGNQLHRRRAAGTLRPDGSQTVRFEMPFAVWCSGCRTNGLIAQGVRFNAEKRRVGRYHSTPIWSFRIKHAACGNFLEIRTDPANTRYEVVEGGRARDYGDGDGDRLREGEGGVPILTPEERERRRTDAFAALEGKVEEKVVRKDNAKRIEELYDAAERDGVDPWAANRRMRDVFRRERKVREREDRATAALKERLGTDIDILPETEQDAKRAALVSFGNSSTSSSAGIGGFSLTTSSIESRPDASPAKKGARRSTAVRDRKDTLRKSIVQNTRAALNPFG